MTNAEYDKKLGEILNAHNDRDMFDGQLNPGGLSTEQTIAAIRALNDEAVGEDDDTEPSDRYDEDAVARNDLRQEIKSILGGTDE